MIPLDEALDRLVHKRAYRRAFLEGRFEVLELVPGDLAALESIDRAALESLAESLAHEVLARTHSGSGSLNQLFPRTIDAWRRAHPEDLGALELARAFMDSRAFDDYRELPFSGVGTSLEEAFFLHCEAEEVGCPIVRQEEFLGAMMKLLVVSPRAAVHLPDCIRRTEHGIFCVRSRGVPTLHAAARGCVVKGPLTPFLVDLLAHDAHDAQDATAATVAARHGVSTPVLEESVRMLSALGILESRGRHSMDAHEQSAHGSPAAGLAQVLRRGGASP